MNRQTYFDFENACSIWQGQFLGSQEAAPIFFVLTFHADAHVPTIHGALYKADLAAKNISAQQVCIVKGTWNRNQREFSFREIHPPGAGGMYSRLLIRTVNNRLINLLRPKSFCSMERKY
jgi:hypothetical protein